MIKDISISLRRSALGWALIIAVVLSGAALITFAAANPVTCLVGLE